MSADPLPRDDRFPESLPEFMRRFGTEAKCAAVLRRWKYPEGFRCPRCAGSKAWFIATRSLDECAACGHQVSLKAGTVMHRSKAPLTKWFLAMYLFVVSKQGISAMDLKRQLGVAYGTAWTWLHKLRSALGARTVELLGGDVEVDETYEVGRRFGGGTGRPKVSDKASLIVGAVEVSQKERGFGRLRLASLDSITKEDLGAFVEDHIAPGSTVHTDGLQSYPYALRDRDYEHRAVNVLRSGRRSHEWLPGIHRVFALLDRVLKGTFQGAVRRKHLEGYLAEFEFRFNRRMSKSRALLFQRVLSCAVMRPPPTYWQIVGRPDPQTPLHLA